MTQEFEGDLAGSVFWGADLSSAMFRDVNLTDVKISHAWLVNVEIDALVDRVVINGVDVTAHVNAGDAWYPLRSMLRPDTAAGMRDAWDALDAAWAEAIATAEALPEAAVHESVNEEFPFVHTLRHLVFAIDKWFTAPVLGHPFSAIGLPNSGSVDFPWPSLDYTLTPTLAETLAVRADRSQHLRSFLASITEEDFTRPVDILENGEHHLRDCILTVFEEEFWHLRYATRDLALLAGT